MSNWGGKREGAGSSYGSAQASGWLTVSEVAQLFGQTPDWVRRMVEQPEHADFASRMKRTGRTRLFPATIAWYYAHEGTMPLDRADMVDFLEHFPLPVIRRREVARFVPMDSDDPRNPSSG